MRTLITNGTIVTADGSTAADVLIEGETIAQIGTGLAGSVTADETIDAAGRWLIPGAIDVHTHMELPFGGTFAKDTFETGTRAAAFGGTTTIVDFAVQSKGQSLRQGLDAWHAKAEGNAVADYGFHMIMSDVNDDTLKEMDGLVAEGIPDFKLFTAYPGVFYSDDGAIFRAMQQTAKNGGLIMMHAENGMAIDVVAADLVGEGKTDPYYHGVARYPIFEGEATNRVIRLAEAAGVPVYIVHLSARDAMNAVREARDRGVRAFAETCPQYLFLSLDDLGHGFEGAKFVCSPPLRPADHQEELWTGLIKDDLQLVSTDHCPFDFEGQKELGQGDFRKIPNGLPGVEDRVDLLHDGGVVRACQAVRDVPPEGHHRGRLGRRRRDLRPAGDPDDQREDPPHGRRLLVLRGPPGPGPVRHRPLARLGHRPRRPVHGPQGRREVPQALDGRLRPNQLTGARQRPSGGRTT
jgi:dihydropyrimidinase